MLNILKILIIYYLTQNHIYTAYILIKEFDLILEKDNIYKYLTIILFVLEFISLLIFLEIIELNFLNLNENTKRNIEKRGRIENILLSRDNLKLINDSDFIDNNIIKLSERTTNKSEITNNSEEDIESNF